MKTTENFKNKWKTNKFENDIKTWKGQYNWEKKQITTGNFKMTTTLEWWVNLWQQRDNLNKLKVKKKPYKKDGDLIIHTKLCECTHWHFVSKIIQKPFWFIMYLCIGNNWSLNLTLSKQKIQHKYITRYQCVEIYDKLRACFAKINLNKTKQLVCSPGTKQSW